MRRYQFGLITLALYVNTPALAKDPLAVLVEDSARKHLSPNTEDLPMGYGRVSCTSATSVNPHLSSVRDYVTECSYGTTCGLMGTVYVYRIDQKGLLPEAKLLFTESTSDYMGGYFTRADLNNDGMEELFFVTGSDGAARSHVRARVFDPTAKDGWRLMTCEGDCAAHDFVFFPREIIGVTSCIDVAEGTGCKDKLIRLTLKDGKLLGDPVQLDSYSQSKDFLDRVFTAITAEDRIEHERKDTSLPALKNIYEQFGHAPKP